MLNFLKKLIPKKENQIFTLHVYDYNGTYVFDKPEWNTEKEAFVLGATEYLQKITNNAKSFNLSFSTSPMPEGHYVENTFSSKTEGSWYHSKEFNMNLWLCPYLFRYYDRAPKIIYLITQNHKYIE